MGGGQTSTQKSSQKSSSTASPWAPTEGILKDIVGAAGDINPVDFSALQQPAMNLLQGQLQGGDNPYTQGLVNSITDASRNAVGGAFSAAGRSFSPSHAAALGKSVTNSLAPYLFQDYRTGISQIPGLAQFAGNLPYAGLQGQSNLLLPIASTFGKTKGTASGTQQTTIPGASPLQMGIGGGLGLLGLGLSPYNAAGSTLLGGLLG